MNRFLSILFALLLPVPALLAQGADALPFTQIQTNPANAALAGAGMAHNQTAAYSAFSNAAILPFFQGKLDAGVSYQRWTPTQGNHVNAGVAFKVLPRLAFSVGYTFQAAAARQETGDYGQQQGTITPTAQVVALGAGVGLGEHWSLGVNLRYAVEKASDSYSGFSGDISAAWQPMKQLRFTAGVATLGTVVVSEAGTAFQQPASAFAGADWGLTLGQQHSLNFMLAANCYFSGIWSGALGMEYAWNKMVFARVGYRLAQEGCVTPSHLGVGLGVCLKGFRLDVSWLTASKELGNSLSAGLAYSF